MATIPLIRNKTDAFYRYQMPKLIVKIEGSGNGIRTVVTNMSLIAKAINRPPAYVTKFFGYEFGAQVKTENNIYSVNGSHDADKLTSYLYTFIEKFVLCSHCENPETDIINIDKKQVLITLKCKACGKITTVNERTHKLTTFIVNHAEEGGKKDSKKKTKSKGKSKKETTDDDTTKTTKSKNETTNGNINTNDDDFENDDFSGEDLKPDILADKFEKSIKIESDVDTLEKFCQMLKEKADSNQLSDTKVHRDLLNEAIKLGIREKATLALCKALFNENIIEQIGKYELLLLRFCNENEKAQKYLLGGIEKIIELFPKLQASIIKILKELYDKDILDENILIKWYDKPSKKYVSKELAKTIREKSFIFIKWLKEAEVEDDSDDDGNEKATKNKQQVNGNSNGNSNGNKDKSEEDENDEDEEDDEIGFSHRVSGIQVEKVKNKEEEVDDSFIDAI